MFLFLFHFPAAISFNGLEAALTSDGEVNDDGELVVDVSVPGLTGATTGAEIMFAVDPDGAATIKSVTPADDVCELVSGRMVQGMGFVADGHGVASGDVGWTANYGSVTFACGSRCD